VQTLPVTGDMIIETAAMRLSPRPQQQTPHDPVAAE